MASSKFGKILEEYSRDLPDGSFDDMEKEDCCKRCCFPRREYKSQAEAALEKKLEETKKALDEAKKELAKATKKKPSKTRTEQPSAAASPPASSEGAPPAAADNLV